VKIVEPDYIKAHKHSTDHRKEILECEQCGCFYCLAVFGPGEIKKWIDEVEEVGQTALCPVCGIDSVIGSKSGYPVMREFLEMMRRYWFDK